MKRFKLSRSVKQWVISFILIDLAFWILIEVRCFVSPIDCSEMAGFGSYFFYLPWSYILQSLPIPIESFLLSLAIFGLFGTIIHGLLGAFLGCLFQRKQVSWITSIAIAFLILVVLAFAFTKWEHEKELARETSTELWAIYDFRSGFLEFSEVKWLTGEEAIEAAKADGACMIEEACAPNGFYIDIEEGRTNWVLRDTEDTEVILIVCPESGCQESEPISFDEYLEAHNLCKEDRLSCPYYNIGNEYELFDVTSNPLGIIKMVERYVP